MEQGTLLDQRVVTATLATLAPAVEAEALQSPCLTIVGEVVRLREDFTPADVVEVVVETFGCDPPESYVLAMAARATRPKCMC